MRTIVMSARAKRRLSSYRDELNRIGRFGRGSFLAMPDANITHRCDGEYYSNDWTVCIG